MGMNWLDRAKAAVKRIRWRLSNLVWFPIKIEKDGAVFKATARNGKEWFIPTNSEHFALWAFKFYELHERYLDTIREGDIVVEVGACTGEYTIPAAQRVGDLGRVFAFEADPLGCECTKKNARLHNLNNIEVINEIVSDRVGRRVSLYLPDGNLSGGLLVKNGSMVTTTLDEYLKGMKVDVLKLTVNGHEPEVLMGAKKLLKNVRSVVFQSVKHKELIRFLEERGFKVRKFKQLDDDIKTVLLERRSSS